MVPLRTRLLQLPHAGAKPWRGWLQERWHVSWSQVIAIFRLRIGCVEGRRLLRAPALSCMFRGFGASLLISAGLCWFGGNGVLTILTRGRFYSLVLKLITSY